MSTYWHKWPAQGEYVKDLNWAARVSIDYLRKLKNKNIVRHAFYLT